MTLPGSDLLITALKDSRIWVVNGQGPAGGRDQGGPTTASLAHPHYGNLRVILRFHTDPQLKPVELWVEASLTLHYVRSSTPLERKPMTATRRSLILQPVILMIIGASPAGAQAALVSVERQLATEYGMSVGDTVWLGTSADSITTPAIVAAIYEPRPDPAEIAKRERHIRLHLPDLATLLGVPDRV